MLTDEERAVLAHIDRDREALLKRLAQLIRFRTVTPLTDGHAEGTDYRALQDSLSRDLDALGFQVETFEADASKLEAFPGSGINRSRDLSNMPILIGRRSAAGRSLLLNAHYDVVPPGLAETWTTPPFDGVIDGDRVLGRGACDMKGGLAAMVEAIRAIQEEGIEPRGSLVVESVPDEEMTSMGTLACCERGVRADAAVIPEPTDLNVLVAVRGSLGGTVVVHGRAGHAEMTQPPWEEGGAVNAISKATKVLEALEALNAAWAADPTKRHRYLDPDSIVPTMIQGGEWSVTHPERVTITFDSMFVPSTKDMRGDIQRALDRVAMEDPWLREHPPVLETPNYLYGAEVADDAPIVAAAVSALQDIGRQPKRIGFGSLTDMVHLVNYSKVPTVSVGPSYRRAHAVDEYATAEDLLTTAKAIALLILRWGSGATTSAPGPST